MSNWKTYKLSDFVEINPRVSLKQGNEYSFVEMKDLDATFKYVAPSAKKELKGGAKFENGDTLFARITPCLENGKICQVKELENNVGFGSTEFLIFRGKENISDTDFVYYLMRSDYVRNNAIQMMSGTSGRQRVEKSALEELEIQVPDLITQKEIAQILSSLDDKIELLKQMNQTLEDIAQAIFKEWFVDFNFPGFDGELVEGLPKGWRMGKFEELTDIKTGKGLKRSEFKIDGKYPVVGANGELGKTDDYLLEDKFLITGRVGTLGAVDISYGKKWYSDNVLIMKPYSYFYYAYFILRMIDMNSLNRGSTQPLITQTDLKNYLSLIPDEGTLNLFEDVISHLFEKVFRNKEQIQTLTQTRDTLLPKLMSGNLEIN
ncbi:MAG: restriction endonuclease subunit S [Candidatus Methanofastidiosa archaeon]|nr:restriction endonuclease subunit S [Candidatus Methanofastidiosa archaeon]